MSCQIEDCGKQRASHVKLEERFDGGSVSAKNCELFYEIKSTLRLITHKFQILKYDKARMKLSVLTNAVMHLCLLTESIETTRNLLS